MRGRAQESLFFHYLNFLLPYAGSTKAGCSPNPFGIQGVNVPFNRLAAITRSAPNGLPPHTEGLMMTSWALS